MLNSHYSGSCFSSVITHHTDTYGSSEGLGRNQQYQQQRRGMVTDRQRRAAEAKAAAEAASRSGDHGDPEPVVPPVPGANDKIMQLDSPQSDNKANHDWEAFAEQQMEEAEPYYLPGTQKEMFDPEVHMATAPSDWKEYESATPLWEEIFAGIGVTGKPLSVAEYMRLCLTHPQHGYYTIGKTAGKDEDFDGEEWDDEFDDAGSDSLIGGDFVTAPEISQIFGETLGIWFAAILQEQSLTAKPWQYVEAGPGKGSLLVDLVRFWHLLSKAATKRNGIKAAKNIAPTAVHLLETSPQMRIVQQQSLERDVGNLFDLKFVEPAGVASKTATEASTDTDGDKVPKAAETPKEKIKVTGSSGHKPAITIYWHDSISMLQLWQKQNDSSLPTFAVCQEFMDALPIYAFEKTKEGWRERMVDIPLSDEVQKEELENLGIKSPPPLEAGQKKLRLRLVTAPEETPATRTLLRLNEQGLLPSEAEAGHEAEIGSVVEINPEAILFAQDMAQMIGQQGGGALIVDYGQEGSHDSIRAFSQSEQMHFLSRPGKVDVTADVDFAALKHAINRYRAPTAEVDPSKIKTARAYGPVGQGAFLMSNGIKERAIHLSEQPGATEEDQENLYKALVRLCSPDEMGERFKVLAIVPGNSDDPENPPPGFAPF